MENKQKYYKLYVLIFWVLFVAPFFIGTLVFVRISNGKMGEMPSFEELENPENNIASEVISSDNKLLGKLYIENRSFVGFDELSPKIVHSFIAIEDIRFYRHSGIDVKALGRVAFGVVSGNRKGGGSTITQQLAKNLFGRDTTTYKWQIVKTYNLVKTKLKEWVTATRLERNYTKEEILVMYLNTVPFGHNAFGIKTAAKTYFNASPDSLKIQEAAVLAGLVKAPTFYSPLRNPERSKERRNLVMHQMKKYGYIKEEAYDSLKTLPLELTFNVEDHNVGLGTYFRAYLKKMLMAEKPTEKYYNYQEDSARWEEDPLYGWCNKNLKPDGSAYNVFTDGLKIYTTVDYRMQNYAEEAMKEHLGYLQQIFFEEKQGRPRGPYDHKLTREEYKFVLDRAIKSTPRYRLMKKAGMPEDSIMASFEKPVEMTVFTWEGDKDTVMTPFDSLMYYKTILRAGFMAMDPHNGHVKAYVGGINFKHFKYDHLNMGKYQAGSTFKPFLYIEAMDELDPCYRVPNVSQTFIVKDSVYTPRSAGREEDYGKLVTLKWGLATSENNISAWLIKKFKPKPIVDYAKKMGIKSEILPVPSLVYGSCEVKVSEMVGAYCTFANKGVHTEPIYVTRIEDRNGNVLFESRPRITEAMRERQAFLMLNLMQGVVNNGTAIALRNDFELEGEIAGKTGTTNYHSDGWFIGITPQLVAGGWVGGEDRPIRFDKIEYGQGAKMALPIYAYFMQKVYADESLGIQPGKFEAPANFGVNLDCEDYFEQKGIDNPEYYLEEDPW